MRIGAVVWFCGVGVFAVARLHAQSTATPPSTQSAPESATPDSVPTFSSGVNLVLVSVVVRDTQGRAVGTLRKEDFHLFDRGERQPISKFSIERPGDQLIVPPRAIETDAGGHPIPGAANTSAPGPIATRFVSWLFDDAHLSSGDLSHARGAAEMQLKSLEPGTRAAIFTTSGRNALNFTDDRDKLRQTLLHHSSIAGCNRPHRGLSRYPVLPG